MKRGKKLIYFILAIAILLGVFYVYNVHMQYRFSEISDSKVYSSAVIPPKKIEKFIRDNDIKTVIDLRKGHIINEKNSETSKAISDEKAAVEKIPGVTHVNIPSGQIPTEENLKNFFAVMDNEESYPVLIHCYHGTGRAPLYSAVYRIEYENFTNEEARKKTRLILKYSSFDDGESKGDWLKNYKPRKKD